MLARYWSQYTSGGVHPSDANYINASNSLRWSWSAAKRRGKVFEADSSLHGLVHLSLNPQPFAGNIDSASIYILMANPGLELSDYDDDVLNAEHMAAIEANLRQSGIGFYPLLPASAATGAGRYWLSRVKSLEIELAKQLGSSPLEARALLIEHFAVIEAGPYHSKVFPGAWCDRLPSSRAARTFVRRFLLPRAQQGNALVLVMRRATFWRIGSQNQGVMFRQSKHAQLSYFSSAERAQMVEFLARRVRSGASK